ncbi:glycoside hydrolase family 3 N-terminal domain-containing protein [Paracoccus fistulariae]|uniref:beta-glucosidase n=1 Tax=Paracoccus fistulariae TaxID=658446 RepID=A0ABY7SMB6_9RHOB|nr:glycoside hydrolase family 3 N-terminal domain-containing protein [Paracoccus fistulariae]MDB6179956.1 glycoside hydrolase family 3 C-terminal domain-containing protein [Paracoccus fistulariae]WCR08050.1 glycoside hydrolase family 3 C-terminal domain-containing protein [Paracoccus fistulariae]
MTGQDAVAALMARMTLAEKIGQLNLLPAGQGLITGASHPTPLADRLDQGQVGAIFGTKSLSSARAMQERALAGSRLGIPLFFAEDVIHGHRTVFPLNLALACSWDMELIRQTSAHAAAEASAEGLHQTYAPMIDVSRDPRWGRVAEGPGEDPLLASRIAAAAVRGFQGDGLGKDGHLAACLKHFVAYGAPQSGRDYDNVSLANEDLLSVYLPPFAAGVRAGAASVMVSFNAVNRLPMHTNAPLIEGWLRGQTGFEGLVVADYTGVQELVAHGLGPAAVVVARALHAGVDMDMVGEDYLRELPALARDGLDAPEAGLQIAASQIVSLIDRACHRVLTLKQRLGLLDDPFRGMQGTGAPTTQAGRDLARRAAARSAVLLKNDGTLPLDRGRRIALIGPFGADRANMLGTWSVSGRAEDVVPLDAAITEVSGQAPGAAWGANIVEEDWLLRRLNVHGVTVTQDPRPEAELLAEALATAESADVIVAAIGEAKEHAGESSSRLSPDIPAPQQRLIAALAAVQKPLVVVVFAGRPLALGQIAEQADALLYAWHGGVAGPQGVADLLYGIANPSGRLAVTLPAHPGEVPLSHADDTTGRPFPGRFAKFLTGWLDLPDDAPRFPFGFGLGYSPVTYRAPELSHTAARADQRVELRVKLRNTGRFVATETVQLYASDPVARVTRPARWLLDFQQVELAPGESRTVLFTVAADDFAYPIAPGLDRAEWLRDPGLVQLHVGPNSRDTESVELTWLD